MDANTERKFKIGQHIKIKKEYLDIPNENEICDYVIIEDNGNRVLIRASKNIENISIIPSHTISKIMIEEEAV